MKQHRLNAYLKLIQELLTCPNGEEWIRLKQHEDLVDAELVQVMEQLASQLLQEGNRQAAIFLHNWAAKLHHILVREKQKSQINVDESQAYASLIQSLLRCSEDNQEKEKLLAEHHNLIGPGLVHEMKKISQQLKQKGSDDSAIYLQNLAAELNKAWIDAHDFQPQLAKETANTPLKINVNEETLLESGSARHSSQKISDTSPLITESNLEAQRQDAQRQLANAIQAMSAALHQLNQTLNTQRLHSTSTNPIWYMDVLERAATAQWLLTTDEIEQLIGVRPKCRDKSESYQRGTWTFAKVGKLGAQTAWKVTKTRLSLPILDDRDTVNHHKTDANHANAIITNDSLAKHPPLRPNTLNNGVSDNEQLGSVEIPEMEDVWA